jgi:hypothetical protein
MGILSSERNLQGDYAEWLIAQLFNLQLAPSTVQKGYDATDKRARTYQIKSRIVRTLRQTTSFDFSREESEFDYLIGVFFSPSFDLLGAIRVPQAVVIELRAENANSFRFRWNRKAACHPRVEKLAWAGEPADEEKCDAG